MVRLKRQRALDKRANIDLIPLIDCVFQILIFFMYSFISMSYFHGLPLDLPKARASQVYKENIVQIDMKKDGSLFFDGNKISYDVLKSNLKNKNKNFRVFIRAEKEVIYNDLIKIMDFIKNEGFSKVVLGTIKDES